MTVWRHIADLLAEGFPCALVTVAAAVGSTPREAGARMVVRDDGGFYGTIGGGALELQAIRWACEALQGNQLGLTLRSFSLGPDLGQCCGGRVEIAVEVLQMAQAAMATELAAHEADKGCFQTVAEVQSGQPLLRRIQLFDQAAVFDFQDGRYLREKFGVDRRDLYLFGAGHVGRALVLALAALPFRVYWIDQRENSFPAAVPSSVIKICSGSPPEILMKADTDAFVLVMTHSHSLDEEIIATALKIKDFPYIGLIGSATKRARFAKRLAQRGLSPQTILQMVCPIGNQGISSKLPSSIAAGVAVELLIADEVHRKNHSLNHMDIERSGVSGL